MSTPWVERVQVVLAKLDACAQAEVLDSAEFLVQKRTRASEKADELSEEEHARVIAALDAVAALSKESGPPVSNRDHDSHLTSTP